MELNSYSGQALATHTAQAFNSCKYATALLEQETRQMRRKVVLPDLMTLGTLADAQGGTCALIHADCCVYVPDDHRNKSLAPTQMIYQISTIQQVGIDLVSTWFQSLSLPWKGALLGITVTCLSNCTGNLWIYCCCALRLQTIIVKSPRDLEKINTQNGSTHITSVVECRGTHFRNAIWLQQQRHLGDVELSVTSPVADYPKNQNIGPKMNIMPPERR